MPDKKAPPPSATLARSVPKPFSLVAAILAGTIISNSAGSAGNPEVFRSRRCNVGILMLAVLLPACRTGIFWWQHSTAGEWMMFSAVHHNSGKIAQLLRDSHRNSSRKASRLESQLTSPPGVYRKNPDTEHSQETPTEHLSDAPAVRYDPVVGTITMPRQSGPKSLQRRLRRVSCL